MQDKCGHKTKTNDCKYTAIERDAKKKTIQNVPNKKGPQRTKGQAPTKDLGPRASST